MPLCCTLAAPQTNLETGRGWLSRKHRGGGRESKHGPRPPSAPVGCAGDRRALGRSHTAGAKLLSERGGHVCPGDAWAAGPPGWGWGCRGGRAQSPSSGSSVWVTGGKGIQGRGASGLDSGRAFSRDVTARLGCNSCDCLENGVRTWHLSRYLLHSLLPPPLWTKPQRARRLDVVSWKRLLGQRTSV